VRRKRDAHEIGRRGIERLPVGAASQVAHVHQAPSAAGIVIGPRDVERRTIARQRLRRREPDRPEDDVADDREEREVLFRFANVFGAPFSARLSDAAVAATADAAVPVLKRCQTPWGTRALRPASAGTTFRTSAVLFRTSRLKRFTDNRSDVATKSRCRQGRELATFQSPHRFGPVVS
jgi:hypothetical protein